MATSAADSLIVLYERAEWDLRRLIRDASLRGARGTERYLRRQQRAVAAIVRDLRALTAELVPLAVREPFEAAAGLAAEQLGMSFSGVDQRQVRALARALEGDLGDALVTVGREADDALRRATLQEVGTGRAGGGTQRQTTARLRQRLADEGVTALVDRGGRRWRLEVYSRMAVRTTSRQAATAGTVERLREAGEDLIAISSHVGSCDVCKPFEGRTYSLSGASETYPRAKYLPPFHPNCRHVAVPSGASFEAFERSLGLVAA